ncbi:MAG: hypothetical protein OEZ34_06080 [Spirochaetia bacterium]|nr:hypothetical protein [Spirochaetia bacterium]
MDRSSVKILLLFFFSGFFSVQSLAGDDLRPLKTPECEKLYTHQLKVHMDDGLLSPVITRQQNLLKSSRNEQIHFCMKQINYSNYKCQMDVRSVIALHECHRIHGGPKQEKKAQKDKDQNHKSSEDQKIKDLEKSIAEGSAKKVSEGDCRNAYGRLLSVFRDSPYLKNNPEKNKMVSYWNSNEAKKSFQNRCVRVFRMSDISCIMKGKDRDSLQACLLQIPSE